MIKACSLLSLRDHRPGWMAVQELQLQSVWNQSIGRPDDQIPNPGNVDPVWRGGATCLKRAVVVGF